MAGAAMLMSLAACGGSTGSGADEKARNLLRQAEDCVRNGL